MKGVIEDVWDSQQDNLPITGLDLKEKRRENDGRRLNLQDRYQRRLRSHIDQAAATEVEKKAEW